MRKGLVIGVIATLLVVIIFLLPIVSVSCEEQEPYTVEEPYTIMALFFEIIKWLIALSGWVTLLYNWFTSKPKIRGQIFNIITGDMPNPNDPTQILTAFNVYLYLTNTRKNTVHILDYELNVDTGSGYEKMERVYGAHKVPNWFFHSETHRIEIPDYPKKLITAQAKPIEYGIPLHGFVLFASRKPSNQFKGHVKRFKITCVDAFRNRHEIVSSQNNFLISSYCKTWLG